MREFEDARKKVRREEREAPVYKQHTYITRTMGGNIPKIRSQLKKVGMHFSRINFRTNGRRLVFWPVIGDHELLKLRYLKNVCPNFDENLFAGTVFDVLSSPSVAK